MEFPSHLKYTEDHEWIRLDEKEEGVAYVGITDYAQSELGEIVYVEVDTIDSELEKGDEFGLVEAVKTTSDLYMPISGTVLEFNARLEDEPELVNSSPYKDGWIAKIKLNDPNELKGLLSSEAYIDQVEG